MLSASYLHGFQSVQHCLAPSQRSFPQAICTVSSPSSMLSRSLPAKLSPSYLHGFLSVQHAVSLPPSEALPKLFPRFPPVQHAVSLPPAERLRKLFPRFPLRPACCLAPSQRSSHKLFARFPLRPACCLAPSQRSSPQANCTVSCSVPAKLSPSYFHGFLSVQHAVSLPPSEAFRKLFPLFPLRPACCLAPSQRSFPQAICTVSYPPSSMLSRSLPAKLSPSYLHGFLSVQHAVSFPPSEDLPKLFPRFPLRPACCLAPSQRSFPQAISTVSCPSSMLSRSLPAAKLSASYLHGFQSVQHCLAPSQRSFLQAICMVSCPSSMLSRSLPAKLSPSYLHGFLSVQHAVSLPLSEALPKLFPRFPLRPACLPAKLSVSYFHARFPLRPACCLAPSQRSFPQAICTVSSPSSMLSRSLPAKLSVSYFHVFLSVQHALSLPACCLAPSQRSSPQAISTVSCPSSMLSLPPSEAFRKLFPLRPACCLASSQRSSP